MFDINEAFIQALQKQELEEAIDYKNDRYNATTAEDTADEREFYGKHMTKRDKVRSLDQARRNLERIGKDPRVTTGQAVDQISFEDTLYTDIANYKDNKNWAKKSAEKGDTLWADEHNKQANKFADKIRAKHNKKQETIETNINVNNPEISKDRMKELMPKILEFIKENDYKNHYFENLAQNGMYSRMRIFGGLSDKFYDYVQAYEQVISAMAHENKTDYVTDLLKYDRDILNLSNEECPLVTTNLTVRKDVANKLGVKDNAPESVVTESKKEEFLDANVNVSTGDISSNLDLGGIGELAGLLASEEPKDSEEKLEEDTGKKSLTYQYEENGNYFYKDDNGTVYVDMSFQPDSVDLWVCSAEYNEPIKQVNANDFELNGNPKTDENFERNEKYKGSYMLLSRLESDCKYYLGNGNRYEKVLWAGSVDKQIAKMKELWNSFPDDMKPEWLSMEDIENYEREMKTEMKTEAEETTNTISHELHTDLLPILNMYQYDIADGVEISREELNEVMQDKAMPIIEKVIKEIIPTAEVKAGKFYNPPYYRFGSGNNDQLDFTVTVPAADYEQLKAETTSKDNFEDFLKETYKSYDGFISYMPNNMKEFDEAEDWKQFVVVLSYYITPFEHQEEFTADVLDYIWGNFPTEDDEDEYDDGDTNWAAEEEAEADERFEDRYMNGGNGFTADKKDESKEPLKETDADMYKRIKDEPRTEKYEKGLKLRDEIVDAWKNKDLKTADAKWTELFSMFSSGYDDEGNVTDEWNNEQALRDMIELNMITDTIEDKCVYDVCDYGKQKAYKEMGYTE